MNDADFTCGYTVAIAYCRQLGFLRTFVSSLDVLKPDGVNGPVGVVRRVTGTVVSHFSFCNDIVVTVDY